MTRQEPLWRAGSGLSGPDSSDPLRAPLAGCMRCCAVACPIRRHDRYYDLWRQCWHDHDRDDAHALGRHHWCLPGDARPLPDDDPHALCADHHDTANACHWAGRWRAAALALAATLPGARPLGVVLLDPVRGPGPGPRIPGTRGPGPGPDPRRPRSSDETMAGAKARAVVVCRLAHIH